MSDVQEQRIGPVQRRTLGSSFIGWMFDGFETSTLILVGGVAAKALLNNPTPDEVRLAVGSALGATLLGGPSVVRSEAFLQTRSAASSC